MSWIGGTLCGLAALVALAPAAPAAEIELVEYAAALDDMARALADGDVAGASTRASALEEHRITFGTERLQPDAALLSAVRAVRPAGAAALSRRVRRLAAALRQAPPAPAPASDRALVEQLRAEGAIARGGEIAEPSLAPLTIPDAIRQAIEDLLTWLADGLARIWLWLKKLWPATRAPDAPQGGGAVGVTLVVVALAVVALAVLAIWTVRRAPRSEATPAVARVARPADEDPLSREAGEWERYARELAEAGRRREAVRAWYHAVLSTLFRAGLLEPRKGRTNWEHVSRLAPDVHWRPQFMDITRRFEREWYGRDESTDEALGQCARLAAGILMALRGGEPA